MTNDEARRNALTFNDLTWRKHSSFDMSCRRAFKALASHTTRAYMNRSRKEGRYRSGQTGQTVNLLALRLRWFESSPAHCPAGTAIRELVSALFAGRHLRDGHRIR